eukprot:TRINITY_DN908_c2_g1_i1.p1 TRINITY_DN908_c2_g1~~TRINITY_DN908_c2_g1_i1.p1  ORF type:complete len:314 (-),score=80.89 TRINITY_DN908_c2_g1_i1:113-1054(-)
MSSSVSVDNKINKRSINYILRTLLAGGIAGCCAKTTTAPLDRVKILFQGKHQQFAHYRGSFFGQFSAVQRIYQSEGFSALYRGNGATLIRIFPYAAIQYMAYEQFKRMFNVRNKKEKPYTRLFSGAFAGATAVTITYPLDLIRSRIAFQYRPHTNATKSYNGVFDAIVSIITKEGGIRKLYRGFLPTLQGIIPYAGVSFFTYEGLKNFFEKKLDIEPKNLPVPIRLFCGGCAGAFGQTFAYPLDVVRRRMQIQGLSNETTAYTSTWNGIKTIFQKEGIRGLYIGLSINYVKVAPAVGVSFVVYEFMKKKLNIL